MSLPVKADVATMESSTREDDSESNASEGDMKEGIDFSVVGEWDTRGGAGEKEYDGSDE